MQLPLKLKASKSFIKSFANYESYKKLNPTDFAHYMQKLEAVATEIEKIQINRKHLSRKVNYHNSKGLQYFIYQQHAVFFKLTSTELQLKYFVAVKRIKKSLG